MAGMFPNLSPELQDAIRVWYPRRHPNIPQCRVLSYYDSRNRKVDVIDPAWVSRTPSSWKALTLLPEEREYEFHEMKNAVANRNFWRWGIPPACYSGSRIHLVANGPSARDFIRPPGDVVVAINGARGIVKPDFWFLADSGYVGGAGWIERMKELAEEDPSVVAIFSCSSSPVLVAALAKNRHFYLTANAPGESATRFYRHLAPQGGKMPTFTCGRQTIISALHFCLWLTGGNGELHLHGCDFSCAQPPKSLDDFYGGASAPGGAERHLDTDEWFAFSDNQGGDGEIYTSLAMLGSARNLDATCAFLLDDGLGVYRHGRGIRLTFPTEVGGESQEPAPSVREGVAAGTDILHADREGPNLVPSLDGDAGQA